jgi:hypothetical protein
VRRLISTCDPGALDQPFNDAVAGVDRRMIEEVVRKVLAEDRADVARESVRWVAQLRHAHRAAVELRTRGADESVKLGAVRTLDALLELRLHAQRHLRVRVADLAHDARDAGVAPQSERRWTTSARAAVTTDLRERRDSEPAARGVTERTPNSIGIRVSAGSVIAWSSFSSCVPAAHPPDPESGDETPQPLTSGR